jgi:dynactin complex subunit
LAHLKAELEIKNRENKEKEKRILNLIEEIDKKEYSIKDHD